MNPDETFSNRFELYELNDYILAKQHRSILEEEYQELEQALYDDISPKLTFYDYELGRCTTRGTSTEDYAIYMIEKKEGFLKLLDKIRKHEELFDLAMDSLTPRQRDVIQVHYFNRNNDLGLSLDFFNEVLCEAQAKLCTFIGGERKKQREEVEKERKQKNIEVINKWQRGREVS